MIIDYSLIMRNLEIDQAILDSDQKGEVMDLEMYRG